MMKQYLKSYCSAGKYCATQDETADADGPHHAFDRSADFPANHASAAADDVLKRIHWIIHKSLRCKVFEIIDGSYALSMTPTSHSLSIHVLVQIIRSSALSPRLAQPDSLCVFGYIEILGFLHGSNWRDGEILRG